MEVRALRVSSEELSSAPTSDLEGPTRDSMSLHRPPTNISRTQHPLKGSLLNSPTSGVAAGQPFFDHANAPATTTNVRQAPSATKVRQPRKKKDPSLGAGTDGDKKEKKPRKPREPRTSGATTARKKVKVENPERQEPNHINLPSYTNPLVTQSPLNTNLRNPEIAKPLQNEAAKFTQNGFSMQNTSMQTSATPQPPSIINPGLAHSTIPQPPPTPPRATLKFDPIRSAIQQPSESVSGSPMSHNLHPLSRVPSQPTTTPSIFNMMESQPVSPSQRSVQTTAETLPSIAVNEPSPMPETLTSKTEVDSPVPDPVGLKKSSVNKKPVSDVPTRSGSPKPPRAKEQAPPLPPGSGLLSSTLFGGDAGEGAASNGEKGPNIVLHIDLKDPNNKIINFARLAEEKYGFAALYPRQAAQRERLARVAAAGAALERSASGSKFGGTSAGDSGDDDISVDIDRDSDNDGDVNMSGMQGGVETTYSGTDGPEPKKRRRRKVEEYDQDDPFVDDSELLWEAQAAASKDGFFVYCGPLVPEGERPAVERADGTIKRGRGRGRGGGPGSRGGRGGAAASAASEGGSARGGGPGSRGGTTTRRPRMRKADRLLHEQQKAEKEKTAMAAAKPTVQPT